MEATLSNTVKQIRFITIGNKDVGKTSIVEKFIDPDKKLGENKI